MSGAGCRDFGGIEVAASGVGGFARLSSKRPLFYSQIFHALGTYYLTTAAFIHAQTQTHHTHSRHHARAVEAVVRRAYMGTDWSLCFPSFSPHTDSPKWKSKVVVCVQPQPENLLHRLGYPPAVHITVTTHL